MVPKGRLIIANISSNQSKPEFSQFISGYKPERIEIITTVLRSETHLQEEYCSMLRKLGYEDIGLIHMLDIDFLESNYYDRIMKTNLVCFMDGHSDICHILKCTSIWTLLYEKYLLYENFKIMGINKGASCLAEIIMRKKGVSKGLGLVPHCIIDTAVNGNTSSKELVYSTVINNECLGIRIPLETLLIVERGCDVYCMGEMPLSIFNARSIERNYIEKVKKGGSVYVKNLKGYILSQGGTFNLHVDRKPILSNNVAG